jgi:gluconolactonase
VFGTESGEIHAFDVNRCTRSKIAAVDGFVLGIAVDGDGDVHACIWDSRSVLRCPSEGGTAVIESQGAEDFPFRTPNHLAFHPDGSLYVSDSGSSWEAQDGAILRIAPTGETTVVSLKAPAFPNGLAIDASGSSLYLLESADPRLSRLEINGDGTLGQPQLLAALPRTVPDGIALASDGSILISCFKPDVILRVCAGHVTVLSEDWQGRFLNSPTNICFFGRGLQRLAATNLGARTIVEIGNAGAPGVPLHYPLRKAL